MTNARELANLVGGTLTNLTSGTDNVALGDEALEAVTSGANNVGVGKDAGTAITTGDNNVAIGATALDANTTGSSNTAVGHGALTANTASEATAIGFEAANSNTTGVNLTAVGHSALKANTTGASNTAVGLYCMVTNTTGASNTSMGVASLGNNSTGSFNVAIGQDALNDNTTASYNTAIGYQAADANTTGQLNVAVGVGALGGNTTGSNNTVLGTNALLANTTAENNVAVGYQAGYSTTTGGLNTFVGRLAGQNATTGTSNTFVGTASGYLMTTGSKNTILGAFPGNGGGLDIRTSSNQIVLSDGDGNPRMWVYNGYSNFSNTTSWQSGGTDVHSFEQSDGAQDVLHLRHPAASGGYGLFIKLDGAPNNTTNYFIQAGDTSAVKFRVYSNGNVVNANNSYGSISDVKLKENIVDSGSQWDDIKALTVRKYSMKADNLDAPNMLGVIAQEVEAAGMGGLVITSPDLDPETKEDLGTVTKQVNYSILYMKAVKALQEAMTRIETLETEVAALKG